MRIEGPICPMPDRTPDSRGVVRGLDGKAKFSGFHDLVPIHDQSGWACRKCSATFRYEPPGGAVLAPSYPRTARPC